MSESNLHSLILACDFRVDDVDRMWSWLKGRRDNLASIGAHHVVLYVDLGTGPSAGDNRNPARPLDS